MNILLKIKFKSLISIKMIQTFHLKFNIQIKVLNLFIKFHIFITTNDFLPTIIMFNFLQINNFQLIINHQVILCPPITTYNHKLSKTIIWEVIILLDPILNQILLLIHLNHKILKVNNIE